MATAAVMAASAAAAAVTPAATVAAAAAAANKFYVRLSGAFGFLVEDVERRQADVRNLLFAESDSCAFGFFVEDIERRQADVFLTKSDSIVISGLRVWHISQPTRDCGRGACE
jgi:hypothetical protein